METRLSIESLSRTQRLFEPHWKVYIISAQGLLGGMVVAWRLRFGEVDFLRSNRQLAVGIISPSHGLAWMLGVAYANNCGREHK